MKDYVNELIIPSSIEHEEFGVNQRGPYHVRLNTFVDR